jgi:hypothetical protein
MEFTDGFNLNGLVEKCIRGWNSSCYFQPIFFSFTNKVVDVMERDSSGLQLLLFSWELS